MTNNISLCPLCVAWCLKVSVGSVGCKVWYVRQGGSHSSDSSSQLCHIPQQLLKRADKLLYVVLCHTDSSAHCQVCLLAF